MGEDKVQKKSCRGIEQVEEVGRRKRKPFPFFLNDSEKILELFWQSSETKSNLKLFVLCLELNKLNKQSVYEIKLLNKFKFPVSK